MDLKKFKKFNLPDKPGVYFFTKGQEILYVGKATSLRSRVRSYFSPDLYQTRGPITVEMVARATDLKWEAVPSVLEALIFEANAIKKYRPAYNIKEKDNKSFNYVVITRPARPHEDSGAGGEELPRVIIKRGRELDFEKISGSTFGPYTSGTQLKEALKIIRRIFPYLDDKSKNYIEFYKQINLVPDLDDKTLYLENIKNIKLFLAGKKKAVLKNLKKEMMNAAKAREFEKAQEFQRQTFALEHINDVALIKEENLQPKTFRIEAYDIAHMSGKSMVGVMTVVEGQEAEKSEYRKFKIRTQEDANDTGALAEVLARRLAHPEWRLPDLIVVDGSTAQINFAKKALAQAGLETPVVSVIKDERHRPKGFGGNKALARKYEAEILLANSEAHRFAIAYHKNLRGKKFLGK